MSRCWTTTYYVNNNGPFYSEKAAWNSVTIRQGAVIECRSFDPKTGKETKEYLREPSPYCEK